ncbi:hypothetical protein [Pseudomonas protegens]|uniref:hypothetical protein n=1 Tax=Pseudomonas protegens TaxID=380021 RepID=UPI001B32C315|nr:hypothetical protein [Pseudomonas protegens]MBP5107433.1 hypothetical protein [Pseudomonas protegens]MBP5133495.1 hypothetical protein [Pseudomonas protegens]MBP5150678.1 hypothetical protein [Pseudomonas protegens]QEN50603.1 hypothetical protein CLA18_30090 [Pseudomonas protegens]
MPKKLPNFTTVTEPELRAFWTQYRDPNIRRLLLKVARYRQVLEEVGHLQRNIHQAWRDQVGGDLVALHLLFQLVSEERQRLPGPS